MLVHYQRLAGVLFALFLVSSSVSAVDSPQAAELSVDSSRVANDIDLTRYSLGQGGMSDKPMIDPHVEQLAQLHPQTIRLFVQEYFNLLPKRGQYRWDTLDKAVEAILATGAKPIMCLCIKPPVLFPAIDHGLVHPRDYGEWEELIFRLVQHCNQQKKFGIDYWE